MNTVSLIRTEMLLPLTSFDFSPPPPPPPPLQRRRSRPRITTALSVLKTSRTVSEVAVDEVFQDFVRERELNGDVISKISDRIWLRNVANFDSVEAGSRISDITRSEEVSGNDSEGGFLKLKSTKEWLSGDATAPVNKKRTLKEIQDDRERRKKLNFLRYEALKRELLFLTVGIGTACSGYCLVVLSVQAALSYATGVAFRHFKVDSLEFVDMILHHLDPSASRAEGLPETTSLPDPWVAAWTAYILPSPDPTMWEYTGCLYYQLLCQHADNLSQETIPEIFKKKKPKKIGIRSEDLQDFFERSVKGSSIALSSPRLVIPAAIYGLWELSQHFAHDIFDFQLVPAMVGLFVYKAACLVQVYRDNEDLQFLFPGNEEGSAD